MPRANGLQFDARTSSAAEQVAMRPTTRRTSLMGIGSHKNRIAGNTPGFGRFGDAGLDLMDNDDRDGNFGRPVAEQALPHSTNTPKK